jgi:hypothetical protein
MGGLELRRLLGLGIARGGSGSIGGTLGGVAGNNSATYGTSCANTSSNKTYWHRNTSMSPLLISTMT